MELKTNDKVRVTSKNSVHEGKTGTVRRVVPGGETACTVQLDEDPQGLLVGLFLSELEVLDAKQEALIELAETLDKARLQANAIESAASQRGVYGEVSLALLDTLEMIFEERVDDANLFANLAYNSLLDGNTVREALKAVVK